MSERMTVLTGDCREVLKTLPSDSVHCGVTSPPYWGLRSYLADDHERKTLEIGCEPTYQEYIANLVEVFREVRRVLRPDGVLWLNLGDCYATGAGSAQSAGGKCFGKQNPSIAAGAFPNSQPNRMPQTGLKPKDLCMIPARVAMALQEDGWYLRAVCPWIKRNGMPESTEDRPTTVIESIFMLTRSERYFYDHEAVKKPATEVSRARLAQPGYESQAGSVRANGGDKTNGAMKAVGGSMRARRSSDWFLESWQGMMQDEEGMPTAFVVNTSGFNGAHFATFPIKLVEPCILAGTSERGCCPRCGAQWERIMDEGEPDIEHQRACGGDQAGEYHGEATKDFATSGAQDASATKARILAGMKKRKTIGWRPSCDCCISEAVPCTVLDPFGGSGTSGKVAIERGRKAVVIELNPEYVGMINERTAEPAFL